MANTATAQTPLRMRSGSTNSIIPIVVSFDTATSDLTIFTPDAGKMVAIIGMYGANTAATAVTYKSASTTLAVVQYGAAQLINNPIGNATIITQPGEALIMQVSAQPFKLLLYVVQDDFLEF